MSRRSQTKLIHEGKHAAEVEVELLEMDQSWSPFLSIEDAYRLDDIREALKRGDLNSAVKKARVYELMPVSI